MNLDDFNIASWIFFNIFSERVGWIPMDIEVPESVKSEYVWIDGLSVTEMEIMHGAYRKNNPNGKCVSFFHPICLLRLHGYLILKTWLNYAKIEKDPMQSFQPQSNLGNRNGLTLIHVGIKIMVS